MILPDAHLSASGDVGHVGKSFVFALAFNFFLFSSSSRVLSLFFGLSFVLFWFCLEDIAVIAAASVFVDPAICRAAEIELT